MKKLFIIGFVLLLSTSFVIAQESSCSSLVQDALSSVAENCSDTPSGEICFGYGSVTPTVNCENAPEFIAPGDTLPLEMVCGVQLAGMESPDTWGVALMHLPIPNTEYNATYVLMGDVWIKNAGSVFSQIVGHIVNDTDLYNGPGSDFDVIGSMTVGTETAANAANCTGNWIRIITESGDVAWLPAHNIELEADASNLPGVGMTTPVYQPMQALQFHTGTDIPPCDDAPENGILIQVPSAVDFMDVEINGVRIKLASTIFVQSAADGSMNIEVLDGQATLTVDTFTAVVSAGARAIIPLSEDYTPSGIPDIEPYTADDVANIPLDLLPEPVDPTAPFGNPNPMIIGVEPCNVLSNQGETVCPLHFINLDGLKIVSMEVKFVSAPYGDWTGSVHESPELLSGDYVSGTLAWSSTCSLDKSLCFIGPIQWEITITDEEGHVSEPFAAQFNCVGG